MPATEMQDKAESLHTAETSWPESRYPDASFFKSLQLSEYETEFFSGEYGRGLGYYLNRLDRLKLSGDRVLDAGCGVGQWSLALSRRFGKVDAIDINQGRLESFQSVLEHTGVGNIQIRQASITDLPYPDETFDAVFCYGVIMFTDLRASLAECYRVLKPGGRVYLCLNADGWYRMLLDTKEDNTTRQYMRHILAKTYLERQGTVLPDAELRQLTRQARSELSKITAKFGKTFWQVYRHLPMAETLLMRRLLQKASLKRFLQPYVDHVGAVGYHHIAGYLLQELPKSGRKSFDELFGQLIRVFHLHPHCTGAEGKPQLQSYLADLEDNRLGDVTRAYQPEEFGRLVERAGFCHYQHATESGIVFDVSFPQPLPMYDGYYKGELCVWETCFSKPDLKPDLLTPESHLIEARQVRTRRYFMSQTDPCLVSNVSGDTYPEDLMAQAIRRANYVGGEAHLRYLVDALCRGLLCEESRFKAIVYFLQLALVRDPVSQPLVNGKMPEDVTAILMTHLGRCGHAARLSVVMLRLAGFSAEIWQLPRHVSAKALVNNRWLLAEADIYKNGVFPVNDRGELVSVADIEACPYLLDRFKPTGWFARPGTIFTQDIWGREVQGYVDAVPFERRGFISGYFSPEAEGFPPAIPEITDFSVENGSFTLRWKPGADVETDVLVYRVSVGTVSRGWRYDAPGDENELLKETASDVCWLETNEQSVSGRLPVGVARIFASVVAVSCRIAVEPNTYFWPSEEAICTVSS